MTTWKHWGFALLGGLLLTACSIKSWDKEARVIATATPVSTAEGHTLTITRVQRPWYAWRNLIISKMQESIPEYQAIKGLEQKFYAFSADHQTFGGIYLWQQAADAAAWFDEGWYTKTAQKYGRRGIVEYYQVRRQLVFGTPESGEGSFWAVLSRPSAAAMPAAAPGLVLAIELEDQDHQVRLLTLWQRKSAAEAWFAAYPADATEYFDTPLLIDNTR